MPEASILTVCEDGAGLQNMYLYGMLGRLLYLFLLSI